MRILWIIIFSFLFISGNAQSKLQPGFSPTEYAELLSLAFHSNSIADSIERKTKKDKYHLEYRSAEVGLLNRWTLYLRDDNVAVIETRGTVQKLASWLANFYAAMIPATGRLQLNDSTTFNYQLSADPKSTVHTGWTIALGHLAPDIEQKIKDYYKNKQVKEFLLIGHSQGAAITFLLRSFLEYEKQKGNIPTDIIFKTYCSGAPKPGNMFYAYDFDFITRNGWSYTVVNAADWVPESPFTVQTVGEFNPTNPYIHIRDILKKQKWVTRMVVKKMYNGMAGSTTKSQRKFEKTLGKKIYKQVKKILPQLVEPAYAMSNNYMRAGSPIILMPDEEYRKLYPESSSNFFTHHMFAPYYMLLKKYYFYP